MLMILLVTEKADKKAEIVSLFKIKCCQKNIFFIVSCWYSSHFFSSPQLAPSPTPTQSILYVLPWRSRTFSCMWPVRSSFVTAVILLKERSRLKALPVTVGTLVNPLWEQLQKSCWLQWSQDGFLSSVFNLWPQLLERKRRTRMKKRAEEQLVGRLMLHEISEGHEVVFERIYKSGRKWVIQNAEDPHTEVKEQQGRSTISKRKPKKFHSQHNSAKVKGVIRKQRCLQLVTHPTPNGFIR